MRIRIMTAVLLFSVANSWAATEADGDGASLITRIFLGFFALIVATQLIPGLILLGSLLKSLFSKPRDASVESKGYRS